MSNPFSIMEVRGDEFYHRSVQTKLSNWEFSKQIETRG